MADTVNVRISQGELRGRRKLTKNGNSMITFLSIPYARPPINELRFQPPQPPQRWCGTLDALEMAPVCIQEGFFTRTMIGQEDCLYLNVYTPQLPIATSPKKAVMVWIHGGGFTLGSGNADFYSPDYLIDTDVVVVTINYRVGILGFLSLDNAKVSGNMGLKDQVAALKWVKENIAAFGGDPDNVTIFGESAGGASVHYLILSPLSQGLFHKAIAQSGSALNPWAFTQTNKERAFKLGEYMGCNTTDTETLHSFLMKQDPIKLVEKSYKLFPKNENLTGLKFPFVPTVEPKIDGAFLTEHPLEALKQGHFQKVPLIIGSTSHEGMICLRGIEPDNWEHYDSKFEQNLPEKVSSSCVSLPTIVSQIRDIYFKNKPITQESISQFIDFNSDLIFVEGVNTTMKHTVAFSNEPVYHYTFQFQGALGVSKFFLKTEAKGTCHGDDLGYIFCSEFFHEDVDPNSPEIKTVKRLTTLWSNFAKYGSPTPFLDENIEVYWAPCTKTELNTLTIGSDLILHKIKDTKQLKFWEELFKSKL